MKKHVITGLILAIILLTAVSVSFAAQAERIEEFTAEPGETGITVTLPAGYAEKGYFKLFWKDPASGEVQSTVFPADTAEYRIEAEAGKEYSFQLFYARKKGLLPAAWEEEKAEEPQGPVVWKVLWMDAETVDCFGRVNCLNEEQHRLSGEMAREFEAYAEELTDGLVDIEVTRMSLEEPVIGMQFEYNTGYFPSPTDVNMKHYALYKYDSVFVVGRMDGIFSIYAGVTRQPDSRREEPGYTFIPMTGEGNSALDYVQAKDVAVHEWLHQLGFYYAVFNLEIPNPDRTEDYGFAPQPWGTTDPQFLHDALTMKMHNREGKWVGVPPEAWTCKPTSHAGIWDLSSLQQQVDPDYRFPENAGETETIVPVMEHYGTLDETGYKNTFMKLGFTPVNWAFFLPDSFPEALKNPGLISPDIYQFLANPGAEITLYAVSRERPEKAYLGIITDADFVKQYDETAYLEQLGKVREEMVGSMQWTDFSSEMIRRRIGGRETAGIKMSYVNERDVRTFTEVFAWQEEGRVNTLSVTSSMEDRCDIILGRFHRLEE